MAQVAFRLWHSFGIALLLSIATSAPVAAADPVPGNEVVGKTPHFVDSMEEAFRGSKGIQDHPRWELPVPGNTPTRVRDPAIGSSPFMSLGNGTIMARLPYPLTEDFELRLKARHRAWARLMMIGLGNAERTEGYFFSWDSGLEGQSLNQGRVDLRKMSLAEPFSTWQFPTVQLVPYVISGAPVVTGPFADIVFSWRRSDGRLRLFVNGDLKRETFDTEFNRFDRIFIRGNVTTHFDDLRLESSAMAPLHVGLREPPAFLVDRLDLPHLLVEPRWSVLSGAANIVDDVDHRRLRFEQSASRLYRAMENPVPGKESVAILNVAYDARRLGDSGTMTGLYLVDATGFGYGFLTELASEEQNFVRLRMHRTVDFGLNSEMMGSAYFDSESGGEARRITFSWDRSADSLLLRLDGREQTIATGMLDADFRPTGVVVYGFSATALIDGLSVSGVPVGAINVKDLGAVGDGHSDDTEALLDALARARFSQAPVYLPPGEYRYNRVMNLFNTSWIGAGPASVLSAMDDAKSVVKLSGDGGGMAHLRVFSPTFNNGNPRSGDPDAHNLAATSAQNFRFVNVHFEGGRTAGLFLRWSEDGEVFACAGRNIRADGIHHTGGSRRITVRENSIHNSGDDMIACVSYIARGGPPPAGTGFFDGPDLYPDVRSHSSIVSDIVIRDNFVREQPWGRGMTVIGGRNILMEGNSIHASEGAGILITSESYWFSHAIENVTLRGNAIRDGRGNWGQAAIFVEAREGFGAGRIVIEDNDINGHAGDGIRVVRHGNRVRVAGNTIENVTGFGIGARVRTSQDRFSVNNLTVENNVLRNIGQQGILIDSRAHGALRILGNTLHEINLSGSGTQSVIHVQSGHRLSDVVIAGNDWTQPGRGQVERFIENRTPAPLVLNDVTGDNTHDIPSNDTFWRRGFFIWGYTWRDPILPHIAVNEEEYPLHDWKIARFGQDYSSNPDASNRADPNGSGLANLLEYAFDRHPLEAALEDPAGFARPRLYRSMAGEDHFVGLMYRKNQDAVDLRYEVEISPNLEPSSWSLIEWAEPEEQVGTDPVSGTPVYRQRVNLNPLTQVGRDGNNNPIFDRFLKYEEPPERLFLRLRVSRVL